MATQQTENGSGRLLADIVSDAEELVQEQLNLFKAEIKEEIRDAKQAVLPLIAGAGVLVIGAFLACFTAVYVLNYATRLELWACFAIVTAAVGIVGGVVLAVGLEKLKEVKPIPEKSLDELKENVRWITKPK
jgi:uncharacterized membrane protein YqjE